MTYYFYWYDSQTGAHIRDKEGRELLSVHPPDLNSVSWRSIEWHMSQLEKMAEAGIDIVLPVYWGFPLENNKADEWSKKGLENIVEAAKRLKRKGVDVPAIGMFYDTSTLLNNSLMQDDALDASKRLRGFLFLSDDTFINRAYEVLLNRKPRKKEIVNWQETLRQGADRRVVIFSFFRFPEYQKMNVDDKEFVDDLYRVVFGRRATVQEIFRGCNVLKQTNDRASFAKTILDSPEAAHDLPAGLSLVIPEERRYFYETIENFFERVPHYLRAKIDNKNVLSLYVSNYASDYNQETFDILRKRFARRFRGEELYIIREISWEHIETENTYWWGAAFLGPRIEGIAQIGPGYDDRKIRGKNGIFQDRREGDFYRESWDAVLASDVNIVAIETWNEWHEASNIDKCIQYGERYLALSKEYIARFKNKNEIK